MVSSLYGTLLSIYVFGVQYNKSFLLPMLVSLPLLALYYTPNLSKFLFIPNYSMLPSLLSLVYQHVVLFL